MTEIPLSSPINPAPRTFPGYRLTWRDSDHDSIALIPSIDQVVWPVCIWNQVRSAQPSTSKRSARLLHPRGMIDVAVPGLLMVGIGLAESAVQS